MMIKASVLTINPRVLTSALTKARALLTGISDQDAKRNAEILAGEIDDLVQLAGAAQREAGNSDLFNPLVSSLDKAAGIAQRVITAIRMGNDSASRRGAIALVKLLATAKLANDAIRRKGRQISRVASVIKMAKAMRLGRGEGR
jgi:hypothetical protein